MATGMYFDETPLPPSEMRELLIETLYISFLRLRSVGSNPHIPPDERARFAEAVGEIMHEVPRFLRDDETLKSFSIRYFMLSPSIYLKDSGPIGDFCRQIVDLFNGIR
jgi:hypothetical protein